MSPQVDHVIEVQLAEHALINAAADVALQTLSLEQQCAASIIRDALNDVPNLNVTDLRLNQAKRGPITAALRRLQTDRLRNLHLEELARLGRNAWMVENGTWSSIERAMRDSHDELVTRVDAVERGDLARASALDVIDELGQLLSKLGVD